MYFDFSGLSFSFATNWVSDYDNSTEMSKQSREFSSLFGYGIIKYWIFCNNLDINKELYRLLLSVH